MEKYYDFKHKSGDPAKVTVVISYRNEHELFQRELQILKDWLFDNKWELLRKYYLKDKKS